MEQSDIPGLCNAWTVTEMCIRDSDVTGNDKNYGFNVVNENSTELVVFANPLYCIPKTFCNCTPVSYTHLDVYKRQPLKLTGDCPSIAKTRDI